MNTVNFKIGMDVQVKHFKQCFKLTWLFSFIGICIYIGFHVCSALIQDRGFFPQFLDNLGVFFMFTTVLIAYAGVYLIVNTPRDETKITRGAIRSSMKMAPWILLITVLTMIFLVFTVLLQMGISVLSAIPYAGGYLMSLLTVPVFFINFIALLIALCVITLTPPIIGQSKNIKDFFFHLKATLRDRWLNVLLYACISLAILAISVYLFYMIVQYAVGMTRAVQWKIQGVYPQLISAVSKEFFLTNIAQSVTPHVGFSPEFRQYVMIDGGGAEVIRYIIMISYVGILSFIVSLPLSIYFNVSSIYFGRLKNGRDS